MRHRHAGLHAQSCSRSRSGGSQSTGTVYKLPGFLMLLVLGHTLRTTSLSHTSQSGQAWRKAQLRLMRKRT